MKLMICSAFKPGIFGELVFDQRSINDGQMRLHHSQDDNTYPGYMLMCFVYIIFFEEQNTLAFNQDTWCHLVLCLQMILLHSAIICRLIA
jgi:hypothetical protein